MVPRRLLTVMLLLLVGLVIASAVAPPPERRDGDDDRASTTPTTATTPAERPASTAPAAEGVAGRLPADKTVRAAPGETVDLTVTSRAPATIEIPELGAMQPAAPGAPAQFVVAFDDAGRYEVRDLEAGEAVGTVVIAE